MGRGGKDEMREGKGDRKEEEEPVLPIKKRTRATATDYQKIDKKSRNFDRNVQPVFRQTNFSESCQVPATASLRTLQRTKLSNNDR